MIRRLVKALLIIGTLSASNYVSALGLGELKLNSALNEKFEAEIRLLNVGELSKNEILPNLASHQDFARAGVERVFFLTNLKFDVRLENGDAYIKVTSDKIVREPFLNFLVELHWPSGRILREYTVLIDPPVFSETPAVAVNKAAGTPRESTRPRSEGPGVAEDRDSSTVSRPYVPSGSGAEQGVTVSVKKNDTLWGIARDNRPSREVSISQTMLAIQKENPRAFIRNNINLLKAGYRLKIPSADKIRAFTLAEALREAQRQEQEWRSTRSVDARQEDELLAEQDEQLAPEEPEQEQLEEGAEATGQLKLLTDDVQEETLAQDDEVAASGASIDEPEELASGGAEEDDESSSVINQDMSAAREEQGAGQSTVDARELQEQVESLKKLLNLKDQQLAMLQANAGNNDSAAAGGPSANAMPQEATQASGDGESGNPAKTNEEKGWLETLLASPMYIGLAILAVLVGLIVLGALSRRKAEDDYPDELRNVLNKAESEVQLPKDLEEELEQEAVNAQSVSDTVDQAAGEDEEGTDEFSIPELETDIDKLVEEADIYITYGRHERALEMLKPAVEQHSESVPLRLKLAEVCATTGDLDGFASQKEAIEALGDEAALSALAALKVKMREPESSADVVDAASSAASSPLENVDQDLPSLNDFEDEVTDGAEQFARDEDALEFTLDDAELEDAARELEVAEGAEEPDQDVDDEDLDFLSDTDEATTKLDLARAYIEMADNEAAQDILKEVLEEGSDEQQDEARKLLDSIA